MDFIEVYPNALSDSFCDRLIDTVESHPYVSQGKTGHGVDINKKNSRDITLDNHVDLTDLKNHILQQTFSFAVKYFKKYPLALMGAVSVNVNDEQGNGCTLTPNNFSRLGLPRIDAIVKYLFRSGAINIQHYQQGVGGYPHWHSEQFPQLQHNEALHRVALFMFYLNDVAEGGETEFYYQNKKVAPKKGTMVIAPAGFTHSHRGNTPISGDKYIVTSWLMFNRAEKLYAPLA
ncbi:2OG-Fe(II) oxygenase [Shewanella intestini]|uniref:2OG-Fe(II) oxygenase n=1 Tax=Shewanella intestini TaxID=2017544 RepID=A0ABS5I4L7_9GAMM|nr:MULTISPECIES: 2OG-Fe(II) oxygenase [Shewanella]MBR9728974.1 2OG-Fe(II) oxygenase [Shewanella intestini]MRG36960.1 2OG-Fe(II) oxygenase [Shewanella sp. XMDDZSB0408]